MNKEVQDAPTRTDRSDRDSLAYHSKRQQSDGLLLYGKLKRTVINGNPLSTPHLLRHHVTEIFSLKEQ